MSLHGSRDSRRLAHVSDLLHEATPPLAWNDDEEPFIPPQDAIAWRVRRYTGKPGRPPAVWTPKGVLHIGLDSTLDTLRTAVKNQPGSYRLYPVDKHGRELAPIACIELMLEEEDRGEQQAMTLRGDQGIARIEDSALAMETPARFFDLYERMLVSRDAHDALLANLLTTLVTSTATIQQSTARLLGAANTTIKVANGVEAIERPELLAPPELDVDALSAKLAEAITPANESKPAQPDKPHWLLSLINGPIGMGVVQFISQFANTTAALHAAQRQAAPSPMAPPPPPAAPSPAAAPQPAPPPPSPRRTATVQLQPEAEEEDIEHEQLDEETSADETEIETDQDQAADQDLAAAEETSTDATKTRTAQDLAAAEPQREPTTEPPTARTVQQAAAQPGEGRAGQPSRPQTNAPDSANGPGEPNPEVMTADDVAAFLGVDRKTVYDCANRGMIPHQRLGKRLLFSRKALIAWLAQQGPEPGED